MVTVSKKLLFGVAVVALALGSVLPNAVSAAPAKCPDYSGKVLKVKTDYWLVQGGQRWRLVDRDAATTWDKAIVTPVARCVSSVTDLPEGGTLSFRAGTRLIKKAGTNTVYAVGLNGVLHPISNPDAAAQWYGKTWLRTVKSVAAPLFDKFTIGAALTLTAPHDGLVVRVAGKAQLYLVQDSQLVKIVGRVRPALTKSARTLTAAVFSKLTMSTASVDVGEVLKITTPAVAAQVVIETKTETKVETGTGTGNTVETDLAKMPRIGANYNGPFPAPEGLVLEGTIGATKYFEPAGTGEYRFRPKIDGGRSINCLDSTRTVINSKGKNYDVGFMQGAAYGVRDGDVLFPKYNDTPRGNGNVGNKYYDEGFRVGYQRGYDNGNDWGSYYDCRVSAYKPGDYDADGWRKTSGFAKAPNLAAVFYPATHAGYGGGDGKAAEETYKWSLNSGSQEKPEQAELNKGKAAVNLSRIQITEAVPEASEANLTPQDLAKMTYDQAVQLMSTKYKHICTVAEPTYETKTYGSNSVTSVAYIQICVEGKDTRWTLQSSSFIKGKTSGHMLIIAYTNPNDIKKSGVNEIDSTKLYSVPFVEQFLSKIQFN